MDFRVVVTGGAGFIGSNLSRYLINQQGCHLLVLDKLTYSGNRLSLADLQDSPKFRLSVCDICDQDHALKELEVFKPTAVLHLAAESHVDRSIDGPDAFVRTNVLGTYHMLQATKSYFDKLPAEEQQRFRFIHVSTDEVYGSLEPSDAAFTESSPYDPRSPYSATKAGSDHLARAWFHTFGLPVIVTNCSNNYGPYQFPEKLIPVVILKAMKGDSIPVYGNGKNVRDWLYVEDHAEALFAVLHDGTPGETYNIGGSTELENITLVRMICGILDELHPIRDNVALGSKVDQLASYSDLITFVTDRPGHDHRYAIDAKKVHENIGWRPKTQLDHGLRKTVQWYLDNSDWCQSVLSGSYQLQRIGLGTTDEETSEQ